MKKLLLSLSVAILGLAAQAQDFKPVKGDVTTEFGLTGGINDTEFKLNEGLLRFRYFHKEDVAFRLGFNVGTTSNTAKVYGVGGAIEGKEGSATTKNTNFLVNLGVEKHFAGTERLSPYVGADITFGSVSSKTSFENATGSNTNPSYADNTSSEVKPASTTAIGLRAVIGADYYIAKRLYLGVEAGFGFAYASEGSGKTTTTVAGATTTVKTKSAGNAFELSPGVITAVRIGFAF